MKVLIIVVKLEYTAYAIHAMLNFITVHHLIVTFVFLSAWFSSRLISKNLIEFEHSDSSTLNVRDLFRYRSGLLSLNRYFSLSLCLLLSVAHLHWIGPIQNMVLLSLYGLVGLLLITAALIDSDTHYLLDVFTWPLILIGIVFNFLSTEATLDGLILKLSFLSAILLLLFVHKKITNKEGLGGGDLKLIFFFCVWPLFTLRDLILLIGLSSLTAAVFSSALRILEQITYICKWRTIQANELIALGPYLVAYFFVIQINQNEDLWVRLLRYLGM